MPSPNTASLGLVSLIAGTLAAPAVGAKVNDVISGFSVDHSVPGSEVVTWSVAGVAGPTMTVNGGVVDFDFGAGAMVVSSLTVDGDLTVNGTTTTIESVNVVVEDPLIKLAKDNVADVLDIGFYGQYNDGATKFTGLFRDASDGTFSLFTGLTEEPTTTVNTLGVGYTLADLNLNKLTVSKAGNGINAAFILSSTEPVLTFNETDASLNEKYWDVRASAGNLFFRTLQDNGTSLGSAWMSAFRTGTLVTYVDFEATVQARGGLVGGDETFTRPTYDHVSLSSDATTGYLDTHDGFTLGVNPLTVRANVVTFETDIIADNIAIGDGGGTGVGTLEINRSVNPSIEFLEAGVSRGYLRANGTSFEFTSLGLAVYASIGPAVATFSVPVTLDSTNALTVGGQIKSTTSGGGTGAGFLVQAAVAGYGWDDTGAAADNGVWDANAVSEQLVFRCVNDALTVANAWLTVDRTGATPDLATFGCPVTLSGSNALTVGGATTHNGNVDMVTNQLQFASGETYFVRGGANNLILRTTSAGTYLRHNGNGTDQGYIGFYGTDTAEVLNGAGSALASFRCAGLAATPSAATFSVPVNAQAGVDSTHQFGRLRIDSRTAGTMYLSHTGMTTATQYAVAQTSSGSTYINAPTGQFVYHLINGSALYTLSGSAATFSVPVTLSGSNALTVGGNIETTGGKVKAGGEDPPNTITNGFQYGDTNADFVQPFRFGNNDGTDVELYSLIGGSVAGSIGVPYGVFIESLANGGAVNSDLILSSFGTGSATIRFVTDGRVERARISAASLSVGVPIYGTTQVLGTSSPSLTSASLFIKQSGGNQFINGHVLQRSDALDTWSIAVGSDSKLYFGFADNASGANAEVDFTGYMNLGTAGTVTVSKILAVGDGTGTDVGGVIINRSTEPYIQFLEGGISRGFINFNGTTCEITDASTVNMVQIELADGLKAARALHAFGSTTTIGAQSILMDVDGTVGQRILGVGADATTVGTVRIDVCESDAGSYTNAATFGIFGIRTVDGSAGTPSLSFASDPGNGLYLIGANNPAMAAAGVATFAWSAAANASVPKFQCQDGRFSNGNSAATVVSCAVLNTWYSLGNGSFMGLLVFRDATSGGVAVFSVDASAGATSIQNGITGFEVRYNAGNTEIRVTSGTVTRDIRWVQLAAAEA